MLKITFYKGCKINNRYEEVFSQGIKTGSLINIFEEYLSNLTKETVEIQNVYYENRGELVLDRILDERNIYSYNYLKIICEEDEQVIWKRYCFINNINIKNDCVYINYEEDVWHSYSKEILGFNNSLLSNTRIKKYSNLTPKLLKLPIEYDGNNPLLISNLSSFNKYYAIIEIQLYERVSGTEYPTNPRKTMYCILADYIILPLTNQYFINTIEFDYNTIIEKITNIANNIPNGYALYTDVKGTSSDLYFSFTIGNIYLLPSSFYINMGLQTTGVFGVELNKFPNGQASNILYFLPELKFTSLDELSDNTIFTKVIDDDYKMISIGTFNNQIKLIHNGTSHNLKISLLYTKSELSIIMNIDNQVIDISDDFIYNVPFETISSEEYASRLVYTNLKKLGVLFSGYLNFEKMISGTRKAIFGGLQAGVATDSENSMQQLKGYEKALEGEQEKRIGQWGLYKNFFEYKAVTGAIYSNEKGVFNSAVNIRNQKDGILKFSINPDNENYVKQVRNKFGYITYEYINDISLLDINNVDYFYEENINYNVIKMTNSNVYGNFPQEIADILNEILNNGIRIIYKEGEDNYAI